MSLVLAIALGGAAGALGRYGVDSLIERRSDSLFPWATFTINMTGCLLVGFVIAALVDRHRAPSWLRAGLVIGFCGALTTFSTFAQETLDLLEARDVAVAVVSVAASVALGVFAVLVGIRVGRLV
jgi:fluoride exporter